MVYLFHVPKIDLFEITSPELSKPDLKAADVVALNFSRVSEVFVDYLVEQRKESPHYMEWWKLDRKR
ncbi:MAG: hypothetical protein ACJAWN_003133 [Neolewinella sp.]|jgi:hypothetical protein